MITASGLYLLQIRTGIRYRQIQTEAIHFPMIPREQYTSLHAENCAQKDGNDRQVAVTYEASDAELIGNNSEAVPA